MASDFCQIPPSDDTKSILENLPPLPSINKLVEAINREISKLKTKYTNKIIEILSNFAEGVCPTQPQIDKFISTRNNITEQLNKVYNKVDRLSKNLSGAERGLRGIITGINVASGIAAGGIIAGAVVPLPIPALANSAIDGSLQLIEKAKFKGDGAQRLVPIVGGLVSANVAIKLFANILRELVCTIEALDAAILECSEVGEEGVQSKLIPISPEIISFIEQDVNEEEQSLINTAYKGFVFKIEEVPFSPTVNRRRALAQNQDGITLLQTELSFTGTPDILIQELKLVIDRDNLRAN